MFDKTKKRCIMGAIVESASTDADVEILNAFCRKNDIEESVVNIYEFLNTNGNSDETKQIHNLVRRRFIQEVDNHTTIRLPLIRKAVINSEIDFFAEDWDVIFANLFPTTQYYEDVCYVVEEEFRLKHADETNECALFNTYDKAQTAFNNTKAKLGEYGVTEDWEIDIDDDSQYCVQVNNFDYFYDINLYKKPIL